MITFSVLQTSNKAHMGKRFTHTGVIPYNDREKYFQVHHVSCSPEKFHEILPALGAKGTCLIIHAPPLPHVSKGMNVQRTLHEKRDANGKLIQAANFNGQALTEWCMLDFDVAQKDKSYNAIMRVWQDKGHDGIAAWLRGLPGFPQNTAFTLHLSSSFLRGKASFHVFFALAEPTSYSALRAWAKELGSDAAVMSAVHAHFIADPIFEGAEDPLAGTPRWKFVAGEKMLASVWKGYREKYPENTQACSIIDFDFNGIEGEVNEAWFQHLLRTIPSVPDGSRHTVMWAQSKNLTRKIAARQANLAHAKAWAQAWGSIKADYHREATNIISSHLSKAGITP